MLLDYFDSRILPGFAAVHAGRVVGYAFCVLEGAKAVIGDVYAYGETESPVNPVCETLLRHLLEMTEASPGTTRIESQLLMFPSGALAAPFRDRGFRSFPRLFMVMDVNRAATLQPGRVSRSHPAAPMVPSSNLILQQWQPEFYDSAAALIHRCYVGHMDAAINDQYRTLHGSQRFLHNIIRFPGCGVFDAENSWVMRDPGTLAIEAVLLCSRVRADINHITQLCVSPMLRGRGIGEALLEHCSRKGAQRGIQSLSLTVTEANAPALRLYERNGFTILHRFEAMVWEDSRRT